LTTASVFQQIMSESKQLLFGSCDLDFKRGQLPRSVVSCCFWCMT